MVDIYLKVALQRALSRKITAFIVTPRKQRSISRSAAMHRNSTCDALSFATRSAVYERISPAMIRKLQGVS